MLRVRRGERAETRSVWRGLTSELGEVEIGACTITDVHGLPQTLLRVVSVENHAVKQDCDAFKNDLNQAAK
jgi:hypothetical protein